MDTQKISVQDNSGVSNAQAYT